MLCQLIRPPTTQVTVSRAGQRPGAASLQGGMVLMPCSWLTDAYGKELIPPANPFWLAGTSRHDGSNGEMTTGSRRAGRYMHLSTSSQYTPVPLSLLAKVVQTLLMPLHELSVSTEVVHIELLSPLCNENRSCPEHRALWQSRVVRNVRHGMG